MCDPLRPTGDRFESVVIVSLVTLLAHHPYDTVLGFSIALVGIALIMWAERRARARARHRDKSHRSAPPDRQPIDGRSRPAGD